MTLKKVFAAVLVSLIMLAVLPTAALAAKAVKATTMRLARAEGEVEVREESGRKLTLSEGMQLYSGYEVETGEQSAAYLSLDDKSAVMLDAFSRLKVKSSGKKLQLQLLEGELLTDVSEKLLGGESFQISTSTMTTGIRGTMLLVSVRDGVTTVIVLEGRVEIALHNESGRVVTVEADHYVCDVDNEVLPLDEEDLSAHVLRILREDQELLERVSPEVQDYVLGMGEAELEALEQQEAEEYHQIYILPEESVEAEGGAIVDQVFRLPDMSGIPGGQPAVPPVFPGDPVVTVLNGVYNGTARKVVTITGGTEAGDIIEYSVDGGTTWTRICPTVTNVPDCEGMEVTVRLTRAGEVVSEQVYYPVLSPAPRSFTVTVEDYDLGMPVLPIFEGELYDTDSGYSLTERYEMSIGDGSWTVIDGEPDEVGHFRLTASVVSDNYESAEATAEFDVLIPVSEVEFEVLNGVYDGTAQEVVYDGGAAEEMGFTVEYSVDGGTTWTRICPTVTNVPDCEGMEVTVRLTRAGEVVSEQVYYPVLSPAPRSFTVTVEDYDLGMPVLPVYEGELYDTDSGYSLTERYEMSIGDGSWTVIDGEPDEVGRFRLTASVVSDNYESAEAMAEFDVLSPIFTVDYEVLNGVYDGTAREVVTLTGGTEAGDIIEYSVDGGVTWTETCPTVTSVPDCEVTVNLRVSREGCIPFTASFSPSLQKADRTVTVRMEGYAANSPPESYVLGGDHHADDSGFTVTELYEVSDGQGGWTALDGQPTTAGDYRVTVSVSSDNYHDAGGMAEFTVYKPTFTVTVAALDGTYSGRPQEVLTITDGLEAGDTVQYSVDGGVTWTETCPTVTDVMDCEVTVNLRVSREGYIDYEKTVVPNLEPAVLQNVTVSMPDYYPDEPGEVFMDADTLLETDILRFITIYEESDAQGSWFALDAQPTEPGNYRVTVEFKNDNYQPAFGSAEFRVLKPSAITELTLTDIAFDDQTETLSGTVTVLWEQGDDGLEVPARLLVTLELLRSGDNATRYVEVALTPDHQIEGTFTGTIETQQDLRGVIMVSAFACVDSNDVTYDVPEHQAASYTTAVYLLEVTEEAPDNSTVTQYFYMDWNGLSEALQQAQSPQLIGTGVELRILRNATGIPATGHTALGGNLEIAGTLTVDPAVNLLIPAGTTVTNSGTVVIADGAKLTVAGMLDNTGQVASNQLITVESNAVVYSSKGGRILLVGAADDPSVMNVKSGGTLTMNSGSVLIIAPSSAPSLEGAVNNSGVINLNNDVPDYDGGGGYIEFNGGSITNSGTITFQPDTYLTFGENETATETGSVTLTNKATGLIDLYGAQMYLGPGVLTNSGKINVMEAATLTLGSQEIGPHALELDNLEGGSITVGADSTLQLNFGDGSNAGTITVEDAGTGYYGGFLVVGEGYSLTNTGTIDKQAATTDDIGSFEIYGTVYSSGTINSVGYVYVEGLLYVEIGGNLNLGWGEFSVYGTLLNDGIVTMEGTDEQLSLMRIGSYTDVPAMFENGGVSKLVANAQISSTGGDMAADNTISNTMGASFTVGDTCTLELNYACSLDVQAGSSLVNDGSIICDTINFTDASVITNNGTINGYAGDEWNTPNEE